MFFKKFCSTVAALSLLVGGTAVAQTTNGQLAFHMQVGADNDGNPIILDAGSVQGSEYTILKKQGDGMAKTSFRADCGEGRLFSKGLSVYNATGELIKEDKTQQEISPQPGTPEANSMEIVCHTAGN
jgi:hypothetical protein